MISVGLLVPETQVSSFKERPQILTAWLHLTDRCNLHCAYCYLPHACTDMPHEISHAAITATFRSALYHNYQEVKLKYAGGEPLLLFPLIADSHHYATKLANQYGIELTGLILSNGTLLNAQMIENMLELDMRLSISLDGVGFPHNCQRGYANGKGSFDDVARAIELALSYGVVPYISITVSGRNAGGLPELMTWILERDLPFSFNFYRENDLSATHTDLQLEEERIIEGMLAAYNVIETNLPRHSLLESMADRANLATPHLRACSVGHSYLVFDTQGRIAKCQMDIGRTITEVNDYIPLTTIRESNDGIHNLTVDEKPECRDCQWSYWCTGGCPLITYRATGRYDVKSPNCNIYKALFPEVAFVS